jgi:oxygen-independent coproporphyrinogen-3 oxidase
LIKVGKIAPVDDQLAYNQFYKMREFMLKNGFDHYELSNFAKPDFYSKHNVSYWQTKSYLGIGPSAHSFDKYSRSWNISNNAKYIKQLSNNELAIEREILTTKNRYNEYLMTGLRTKWGVNLEFMEKEFGIDYVVYFKTKIQKYLDNNQLYRINTLEIGVKPEALFLIDGIISELFWV